MSAATSGGGGGQIMVRVVDLSNPGETRPVWCQKDNCLHMAVLYPLITKLQNAVVPADIVAGPKMSLVSYAIFIHPTQAQQYRQFCEIVDIPRDDLTNKLANLPPQPTTPKVNLEKGLLVLAKGSKDSYYFPAEILEVSGNREKYHVQFIGTRHLRGDKKNQCLLKQSDLKPLYQGSSLRAGMIGKEFHGYWPSRMELDTSTVKLSRAKKDSALVAPTGESQNKRKNGVKSTATEGEVDANPRSPKRSKTQQYKVLPADASVLDYREAGHPLCEECAELLFEEVKEEIDSGKCKDCLGLEEAGLEEKVVVDLTAEDDADPNEKAIVDLTGEDDAGLNDSTSASQPDETTPDTQSIAQSMSSAPTVPVETSPKKPLSRKEKQRLKKATAPSKGKQTEN